MSEINSKIPQGPLAEKWTNYKNHQKLVNPANKRRLNPISAKDAAAEAPAKPVPTTITSKRRLLAGFTNFW